MAALPLIVLAGVLGIDLWVLSDATARADRGDPVVASIGSLTIDRPGTWFVACLLLAFLFIPLYVASRNA